jgi:SAM-dependent methyltransferase
MSSQVDLNSPPGVDPTRASVARVYDYLLGGKDNYEIDRATADQLAHSMPEVRDLALENRAFLIRVCRFLATSADIDQYLDCGSGLPTAENVHQVVHRIRRDAKVVYSDHDPLVTAHGRALLDDLNQVRYVEGDIFAPDSILANQVVRAHLDWEQPIALFFVATLHHHKGQRHEPAEVMRRYIDALPSGSYVVISHILDPADSSEDAAAMAELMDTVRNGSLAGATARTYAEIGELFHGLEFVPSGPTGEAGLVPLVNWWPDGPRLKPLNVAQRLFVGGVARKP